MDVIKNKIDILERIKAGGSASVVTEDNGMSEALYGELKDALYDANIIPVCIQCDEYETALELWKQVFLHTWEVILPYMDEDVLENEQDLYDRSIVAVDTSEISVNLESFLEEIKESLDLTVCYIFNHFDELVVRQEEPDVMKVRGLTSLAAVVTISKESLETLTEKKFNDKYFCNQFITLTVE